MTLKMVIFPVPGFSINYPCTEFFKKGGTLKKRDKERSPTSEMAS